MSTDTWEAVLGERGSFVAHDAARRFLSELETVDGRTTSFAYDAAGDRTLRITPSGARSTWEYDAAGRTARLGTAGHTIDFVHTRQTAK